MSDEQPQPGFPLQIQAVPTGPQPIQAWCFGFTTRDPEAPLHPGFIQLAFLHADGVIRFEMLPFERAKWLKGRLDEELTVIGSGLTIAKNVNILKLHDGDGKP